jgi:hypothetical protein
LMATYTSPPRMRAHPTQIRMIAGSGMARF